MTMSSLRTLYHSLDEFEKSLIQQQRQEMERNQNIRFTNIESYLFYLAQQIINRQHNGEFVPRNIDEARSGNYF